MRAVRRRPAVQGSHGRTPLQPGAWPGSVVSRRRLLEDRDVQCLIGAPDTTEQFRFAHLDASVLDEYAVLDAYLFERQPYGVILIDEIHNLRPSLQEHLLELLHDGTWQSVRGGRRYCHYCWTLIGTTTDEARLRDSFLSRFDTVIQMREYSEDELRDIVRCTPKQPRSTASCATTQSSRRPCGRRCVTRRSDACSLCLPHR